MQRPFPFGLTLLLTSALCAAACSSGPSPADDDASQTTPPTVASTVPTTTEPDAASEPAVRSSDNPIVEGSNWIGRGQMTDTMVELIWSEVEGDSVDYRLYRIETTAAADPDGVQLEADLLIYQGPETTFTDANVVTRTFYTYLLEVDVDEQTLSRRWTSALAVTDTEPPSPIIGLMAEITPDGVLLSWEPSSDAVEFASYSVSIDIAGELTYIGGGGDVGETSFLDDRPNEGSNTYIVQAVDFHNNRTEPVSIIIEVG